MTYTEQTKIVLTRVKWTPHYCDPNEFGFYWRGEIENNGKLERKWEWEILKDEEVLSLSYVIQSLEKEVGRNIDITVKSYINSDIGYKFIPVFVYLKHCDKSWDKLREELLKYVAKDNNRKTVTKNKVTKQNGFNFLMLDKE